MWEAIQTHNLGADRVKEARLQTLIMEFKNLKMSDNDSIDAYAAKLSGLLFKSHLDLKTTGFEDVFGRLKAYEERVKQEDKANDSQEKLLYAMTDYSNRNSDSSRGRGRGSNSRGRGQRRGRGNSHNQGQRDSLKNRKDNRQKGCDIRIRGYFSTMRNSCGSFLIKVPRSANRLYKAQLKVGKPYCLQANIDEESWLWHVRLGHIGFGASEFEHKFSERDRVYVMFDEKKCWNWNQNMKQKGSEPGTFSVLWDEKVIATEHERNHENNSPQQQQHDTVAAAVPVTIAATVPSQNP
ncbi:hypothetical protein Tco_0755700 [Tanacetum coccineum]